MFKPTATGLLGDIELMGADGVRSAWIVPGLQGAEVGVRVSGGYVIRLCGNRFVAVMR